MPSQILSRIAERPSLGAEPASFLADCLRGLRLPQKALPCKWLYDEEGSKLFEAICETREYYPTRTEIALLQKAAAVIGDMLAPDTALIEFGSGASRKTRLLLDAIDPITSYVPIDISEAELARATKAIGDDYPWLKIFPIAGDFTIELDLGPALMFAGRLGFFPGSTLGNFTRDEAVDFLATTQALLGLGSRLLLGVDLAKDVDTLLAAYDDAAGVTAAFNLNLLTRMKRELAADVELDAFHHRAIWNADRSRIEMHLVCARDHHITVGDERFSLIAGETIHTENSHKYDPGALTTMFAASGWTVERRWLSESPAYGLFLLRC